jgi:predicted  nucleic acid-binding Zn-ribbon protein
VNYLKAAFTTRWNLLLFGGGLAAAFIVGAPLTGILLPLVAAGEIYYLASMTANDRFRAAIDARDATSRRAAEAAGTRQAYDRIRSQLPPALLARFDRLRDHCERLVALAGGLGSPATGAEQGTVESLDRLLWGYLRMIWNASQLSTFLDHTDATAIGRRITELEQRLARLPRDATAETARLRATVEDHLRTSQERLETITGARRKLDVVTAEIERLEAKIAALAESTVARRDVGDLARRVDEVAEGMKQTDETMRRLELPPDLEDLEEPPRLLREES